MQEKTAQTRLLHANRKEDIAEAGRLLRAGEIVAIPTETVYGLAANALDGDAVRKIFEAKGRPQDNPLIVHISALSQLEALVEEIPPLVYAMAEHFWPGPLTMVMKKSALIPDQTSAGLDTVGIRMPSHPAARAIIEAAGVPLAAPSANTSGKPSPTSARDTLDDMDGKIPAIVDGGACSVGVESTVVDMTRPTPQILRPGAITEEMIAAAIGAAGTDQAVYRGLTEGERPKAPGMKYRHYAPKAPVILFEGAPEDTAQAILDTPHESRDAILCFSEYLPQMKQKQARLVYSLGESWDHASHSRRLFALLRHFDHTGARRILAQCPRVYGANAGTVNRIRKSAGFRSVDCRNGRLIIGVTGRTGSGKSVFSRLFAEKGATVLDADAIYRELTRSDAEMRSAIEARFPGTVTEEGLDRRALADKVFSDQAALSELNRITHHFVRAHIIGQIADAKTRLIVLDVPILFGSGLDRLCDLTLAICTDPETSIRRILSRDGLTRPQAEARLLAQPDDAFYAAHADVLLDNRGTEADFQAAALAFYEKYCK